MSLIAKVEFEIDVEKLLKGMVTNQFGTAAKLPKITIAEPVKKSPAVKRATTPAKKAVTKAPPKKAPTKKK